MRANQINDFAYNLILNTVSHQLIFAHLISTDFFFSLNDFIASNDIFVPYASRVKWVSYMLLCLHDFPAAVVQTSGEFWIICKHIFIWLQSIFICIAFLFYRKQRHIPRFPIAYISVISFLLLSMCGCVCECVSGSGSFTIYLNLLFLYMEYCVFRSYEHLP